MDRGNKASPSNRAAVDPERPDVAAKIDDLSRERFIDELFRAHWDELVAWLRKQFGPGPPEPEEIAQNAFTIISGLPTVDNIRYPKSFLYTVATHNATRALKNTRRIAAIISHDLKAHSEELEEMTPERLYISGEALNGLTDAVKALPEKQREILVRSRIKGQTYMEIGKRFGWSEADISRQLKQVLSQLRDFKPES